ncbi:methionine biosynthesis protein MetW [Myxococcota bacterium]|nr:methionine biosynthesis protein MetW [Myxococcota bacterium]
MTRHLSRLIPPASRLLDVGCGDGLLTSQLAEQCVDVAVTGVDVLIRKDTHVPVSSFDGVSLPFSDGSFDVVMMVDVVHHSDDPFRLLSEAARVASRCLVLKDHTLQGALAAPTLAYMDRFSNLRHGVDVPCNYWTPETWSRAFGDLQLHVEEWDSRLALYPWGSRWLLERSMHFVARLGVRTTAAMQLPDSEPFDAAL